MKLSSVISRDSYVNSIFEQVQEMGIYLSIETDFSEFVDTCRELEGKSEPINLFSAEQANRINAFWVKGTDASGKVVHVQAIRLIGTEGADLGQFFRAHADLFKIRGAEGMGIDLSSSIFNDAPCTRHISGKLCYQGEIWLDRSVRGKKLAFMLPRFALAFAHLKWCPDYMFGFVATKMAERGLSIQYGYTGIQPGAIMWYKPDEDSYIMDWLVWTTPDDMNHMMKYPASGLAAA